MPRKIIGPVIQRTAAIMVLVVSRPGLALLAADGPSVAEHESIQEALDANRGRLVFVPAGDYGIEQRLRVIGAGSGLFGPGRIVQQNPEQPLIVVENADNVVLRGLTLARPAEHAETKREGILVIGCDNPVIENVRVIDNRTRSGVISLRDCAGARISRCLIENYMRVTVDDRTQSPDWGYAFNCTDGTGISVVRCVGTLIEGNRVIEKRLLPTPELKAGYGLGEFIRKNRKKGEVVGQTIWDANYTDNWQQGSGIIVTAPEVSDLTRILGNHIQNAAQGIDLHCDHVIVANNVVANSFVGMKAMHGSRNVVIQGNQFVKNSLWAIGLMPGTAAHASNTDGGSVICNNIISDFGHGDANWIWGNNRSPFKFEGGQEPDDPPLADVIIQGNIVHRTGEPRYRYAVTISGGTGAPQGLRFFGNLFHPGREGVSNQELKP